MLLGVFSALAACFVWGFVFVVPLFLTDFSAIEVALGRYMVYGVLSSLLLLKKGIAYWKQWPKSVWMTALFFGLISNIIYYIGLVLALRFATPPITVLIIGLTPITVAFYGNWHTKECHPKSLVLPCLWMLFGMILVNVTAIDWSFNEYSFQKYLLGLSCASVSLFGWTWFAVKNAQFLRNHPTLLKSDWTNLLGFCSLLWVVLSVVLFTVGPIQLIEPLKFSLFAPSGLRFLAGALTLGMVCSWLGCYLWNQASSLLPLSLMGGFIIFETIFGLFFIYLFKWECPSLIEFLGVASMLGGILSSIFIVHKDAFRKKEVKD